MPDSSRFTRRDLLKAGVALSVSGGTVLAAPFSPAFPQKAIPRWRGFNLLDFFQAFSRRPEVSADDELRWVRDWGFNFVRIPMDYWFWIDSDWRATRQMRPEDATRIDEKFLEKIDRIIELGRRFGLHVNLNLHRAPGYCINNSEREPYVLWSDSRAEDAFLLHWDLFAKRYREISEFDLSFNLVNEAPKPRDGYMRREDYIRVMRMAAGRIREISPRRLVMIDGLDVGNSVVEEMIPTGVAQSVHAYWPGQISHYRAAWVDRESKFPEPAWPVMNPDGTVKMGRQHLEDRYAPWGELARKGIGVHCGECGCYNKTPHPVFLAWFEDVLDVLSKYGIGYSLWNLRGSFGVLDSGRADVAYEDWYGRQLDRKLLSLMQKY